MKKRIKLLTAMFVLTCTMTACQGAQTKDSSQTADTSTDTAKSSSATDSTADSTQKTESTQGSSQRVDSSDGAKGNDDKKDYTTGKPWLDPEVPGNVTADTPTDAKDNYALFVNKDKILQTEIEPGRTSAGTVPDMVSRNNDDVMAVLKEKDENADHGIKLARDYYELWLDWDKRNELAMTPLKDTVDEIEAINSVDDLSKYMENINYKLGYNGLFIVAVGTDFDDATRNLIVIKRPELIYGSEENPGEGGGDAKDDEADTELLKKGLKKYGYSEEDTGRIVANTLKFEDMVKDSIMSETDKKKPDAVEKMNNKYNRDEMLKMQGKLPILQHIQSIGVSEQEVYLVEEPKWFEKINEIFTEENLPLFKDWLVAHAFTDSFSVLDRECYEWASEDGGVKEMKPDDLAATEDTRQLFPWQIAKVYCEKYCNSEDRDKVAGIIDEIKSEYKNIITDAKFISDETKKLASDKLDNMLVHSLYPDDWAEAECDDLNFKSKEEGGTYVDARLETIKVNYNKSFKKLEEPVKRDSWVGGDPTVANCFYSPQNNTINILAGFARGGVYNSEMGKEELYAKVGTVIGHEISHAFDSIGSQFDAEGNKKNWWTDEDKAEFLRLNENIVKYFDKIELWEGQKVNGVIVTGEMCADMGGVAVALRLGKKIDGFDYDKFFKAYADVWLNVEKPDDLAVKAQGDAHPPAYLRVNAVLQQFDEFLDLYDIKEGDKMYLAPEERIRIWY